MLSLTWTRANTVQCYIYKVKNSKLEKLKLNRKLSGNKIWRKLDYMCMFYLNFVCQNIRIQRHLYFTHDILRRMHSFVTFKIKTRIRSSFFPFTSEIKACDLSSFCPLRLFNIFVTGTPFCYNIWSLLSRTSTYLTKNHPKGANACNINRMCDHITHNTVWLVYQTMS